MEIIEDLESFPDINNAVVTSGTFDGVHLGHRKILKRLVQTAKEIGGASVVLTFWPHPRFVLFPDDHALKLISSFEEKAAIIEQEGVDFLIKIKFTKAFSQISSEDFIQTIIVDKLRTKKLVIGYDHHFGKNREGSFEYLQKNCSRFGFEVEEIKRQDIDDVGVSSTKIRKAIEDGNVDQAATFLGKLYALSGVVVQGHKTGKKLGYPTANMKIEEGYKLIPKDGVYAVRVKVSGQQWGGMMNIGHRPTIENAGQAIEVNIFDLDQNIYDESITIEFLKRIRDEQKFESLEALKAQLRKDKIFAQAVINEN